LIGGSSNNYHKRAAWWLVLVERDIPVGAPLSQHNS
jgi:hypothetical protein